MSAASGMNSTPRRGRKPPRCVAAVRAVSLFAVLAGAASARGDEPLLTRPYLTGDWGGWRTDLAEHGVYPYGSYLGMVWGNLAGGEERGARATGFLTLGLTLDLARMGAWSGLGAVIDVHWWHGPKPTEDLIGGLLAMALSGWEAAATFRVYDIYLRQSWDGDRYILKIGQMAADNDFMLSRYAGVFMNAAFGDLPSQNLNIGAPVYPLAAPGAYLAGTPLGWLTGRVGIYTGDAGHDVAGNHGFDWEIGNRAGYSIFSELTVTPTLPLPPGAYTAGGIYNTGGTVQFGASLARSEHYEIYGMIDQALIEHPDGTPRLGAFARMSGTSQDTNTVVGLYADGGLALYGPMSWRPNDVLGVAMSILRFTDPFIAESDHVYGDGEAALELTYQLVLTPWLIVQPDFQCFFNPAISRRDAQALGIQALALF